MLSSQPKNYYYVKNNNLYSTNYIVNRFIYSIDCIDCIVTDCIITDCIVVLHLTSTIIQYNYLSHVIIL